MSEPQAWSPRLWGGLWGQGRGARAPLSAVPLDEEDVLVRAGSLVLASSKLLTLALHIPAAAGAGGQQGPADPHPDALPAAAAL